MLDKHRIVRESRVQIRRSHLAPVRNRVAVVAISDDEFAFGDLEPGLCRFQRFDDRSNRLPRTSWWSETVCLVSNLQAVDEVTMSIKESGNQCFTVQVNQLRRVTFQFQYIGLRPDREDLSFCNRQRFGRRVLIVNRDNISAVIDDIGGIRTLPQDRNEQKQKQWYESFH